MLLTLKDARKLAVFDVNAVDIVKTIPLQSPNVLVAAGSRKFLIAYVDEKRFERWDLATLERDGDSRPSPFDGQIKALAMGSDSDGPALVMWLSDRQISGARTARGSFLDVETMAVLKLDATALGGSREPFRVSSTAGSFGIDFFLSERPHLRASAGGGLFGICQSRGRPSWFGTLMVHGGSIAKTTAMEEFGYVVPGVDGRTVFTCAGGRLDAAGRFVGGAEPLGFQKWPELTLPSADPCYYMSIGGLPSITMNNTFGRSKAVVTVSVHTSGDGLRLLTVHGLGEMAAADRAESFLPDDFTVDKRFHLVPAADLLITVPPDNYGLVIRRLKLDEALERVGTDHLIVKSAPSLLASAGATLEHQVTARSKKGGLTYALAAGPEGLTLAPDGKLTWRVPRQIADDETTVLVRVGDASGQEIFHSLRIHVKGAVTSKRAAPRPPRGRDPLDDDGLVRLGGALKADGTPRGSGKEIQPPSRVIPPARLTPQATDRPLVLRLDGTIGDVVVGGGGRFLLLALKPARKIAVFDVVTAEIVKTLPVPSPNALIAAGAKKLLVVLPEENIIQRWDLATLERDKWNQPSPIAGRIRGLALGCDSDGPALVYWSTGTPAMAVPDYRARLSFIDVESLNVLKIGSADWGGFSGTAQRKVLSRSGGSVVIDENLGSRRNERAYVRASPGGGLFGIWCSANPCYALEARGDAVSAPYIQGGTAHFPPGPDGRVFFASAGGRRDVDGRPIGRGETYDANKPRELAFASNDPSYYLLVAGLPSVAYDPHHVSSKPGAVTASVHAAGDGSRLLTVHGLDEMTATVKTEDWYLGDVTTDKRFHFVPAAKLLITIPPPTTAWCCGGSTSSRRAAAPPVTT